jgi:dTDP-4-dehydrorhamnose reductase
VRVLITGSGGQVGQHLVRRRPHTVETIALTRADCDIANGAAVLSAVREFTPDAIINAAAYTDVDGAESNAAVAFSSNSTGAANIAAAARENGARLLHISTDYVFDGRASTPYQVSAEPSPRSVYGSSKLAGEIEIIKSGAAGTIVRTGWIYSECNRNFLLTILGLMRGGRPVRVVTDQVGTPTSASDLADFLWRVVEQAPDTRLLHWANAGVASWYDFAVAIRDLASERGLISPNSKIEPVLTEEYYAGLPAPARARKHAERPAYSVLDSSEARRLFGPARHWRAALADSLDRLAASAS